MRIRIFIKKNILETFERVNFHGFVHVLYNNWLVYDITLDVEKIITGSFLTTTFFGFLSKKFTSDNWIFSKLTKSQTGNWSAGTLIRKKNCT